MSNTVHKIRDVDQFLHVLETAQAQGLHVKLGRFGRSLVVTPLPMKNGVPADKRISQDQAAVARKLNQLVQRELVRAGQGASVSGLRERRVSESPATPAAASAFVGILGRFDGAEVARKFGALTLPTDATPAQVSFFQQLAEVNDLARRLELPSVANWSQAAASALADAGRTPHQRLKAVADVTQPVAKDLGYLTAVMKPEDAHTLEDALTWVQGPGGLAERATQPDPDLPTTRAGLAARMQDAGQRLREEARTLRAAVPPDGQQAHRWVQLGDLGRDAARLCGQDLPPDQCLAQAHELLRVQLAGSLPGGDSPVPLQRLAHELQALSQHAGWLLQQPVSAAEPTFVSKAEQARRLQAYEGRQQVERDLNEVLTRVKQVAAQRVGQGSGDFRFKELHAWAVGLQSMLLAPKVAGQENPRLDAIRAAIWDGGRHMVSPVLADSGRLKLSDSDQAALSALLDQFHPIGQFLAAHHEPDVQEWQWLKAHGHELSTALPLTSADAQSLEGGIQRLAQEAVGLLVSRAQQGAVDPQQTQRAVAFLSSVATQALTPGDEPSGLVRLRHLVDVAAPDVEGLDVHVQQAAERGDVPTAQALVRLREHIATAHAAVYPPHAGPSRVPVHAHLHQDVERAQALASSRAAAEQALQPAAAVKASSATAPVVGAGGASAALPSNAVDASAELAAALASANALFSKFGHGKVCKAFGETVQTALRLLTDNRHQAPAADRLAMARGLFDPLRARMQEALGPQGASKSERAVILSLLQALERSRLS